MIDATVRTMNEVVADFLACKPSDEDVLGYFMPDDIQSRVHFLLDLNGEDELTCEEARELDELGASKWLRISAGKRRSKRRQRLGKHPVGVIAYQRRLLNKRIRSAK